MQALKFPLYRAAVRRIREPSAHQPTREAAVDVWKFICNLTGHKRDGHRVKHDGNELRTVCKRCGVPMVKGRKGWRVERSKSRGRSR